MPMLRAGCASPAPKPPPDLQLGSDDSPLTAGTPVRTGPNQLRVRRDAETYCISGVTTPH